MMGEKAGRKTLTQEAIDGPSFWGSTCLITRLLLRVDEPPMSVVSFSSSFVENSTRKSNEMKIESCFINNWNVGLVLLLFEGHSCCFSLVILVFYPHFYVYPSFPLILFV